MVLHLTNGKDKDLPLGSALSGYAITGVTLDYNDMRKLLLVDAESAREELVRLFMRYAPNTNNT